MTWTHVILIEGMTSHAGLVDDLSVHGITSRFIACCDCVDGSG
jgi:hypothetical protein